MDQNEIEKIIEAYESEGESHTRYESWSRFYIFFNSEADHAYDNVHLTAYLASWGMYRGSSELLKSHDYTVHDGAVEIIRCSKYASLNGVSGTEYEENPYKIKLLFQLVRKLKDYYRRQKPSVSDTDTLVSKILLGCLACIPAYDTNFVAGVRSMGWRCGADLTEDSFKSLLKELGPFKHLTQRYPTKRQYPFFKLVDMYFFQTGKPIVEGRRRKRSAIKP